MGNLTAEKIDDDQSYMVDLKDLLWVPCLGKIFSMESRVQLFYCIWKRSGFRLVVSGT